MRLEQLRLELQREQELLVEDRALARTSSPALLLEEPPEAPASPPLPPAMPAELVPPPPVEPVPPVGSPASSPLLGPPQTAPGLLAPGLLTGPRVLEEETPPPPAEQEIARLVGLPLPPS